MNNDWYFQWVQFHRKATAAMPDAVAALLENEAIAIEIWEACSEELHECTRRLVATHRTPKFANEHTDAVGMELVTLRKEREREGFMVPVQQDRDGCPMRCDKGILHAPMPDLVRTGSTGRHLARTCVVLCDMCPAGRYEIELQDRLEKQAAPVKEEAWKKKKLRTLSNYLQRTNGIDGIHMLREYESRCLRLLASQRTDESFKGLPAFKSMIGKTLRVPYKERPRGPEYMESS